MKNIPRIIFGVVLIGSVFFLPWWGLAAISALGAYIFPRYIEIVIAGVLYDVLYGANGLGIVDFGGVMGLVSSVMFLIAIERIKKEIRS